MAPEQGWWWLTTNVPFTSSNRNHIADMIRDGADEGPVPVTIGPEEYIEWPPYGPRHIDGLGNKWIRRFVRRAAAGDYAFVETAFWIDDSSVPAIGRHIRYVLCSDPNEPDTTAGFAITLTADGVRFPEPPDEGKARQLCALVDPRTITWDGTPFLMDGDVSQVLPGIDVQRHSQEK